MSYDQSLESKLILRMNEWPKLPRSQEALQRQIYIYHMLSVVI